MTHFNRGLFIHDETGKYIFLSCMFYTRWGYNCGVWSVEGAPLQKLVLNTCMEIFDDIA